MRVVPQTHAAARIALAHAVTIVEAELVASHDNPSIAPDGRALSNGNFDSVPYGVVARLPAAGAGARPHRLLRAGEQARLLGVQRPAHRPARGRRIQPGRPRHRRLRGDGGRRRGAAAGPADDARGADHEHRRGDRGPGDPDHAERAPARRDARPGRVHRRGRAVPGRPGGRPARPQRRPRLGHAPRVRPGARARRRARRRASRPPPTSARFSGRSQHRQADVRRGVTAGGQRLAVGARRRSHPTGSRPSRGGQEDREVAGGDVQAQAVARARRGGRCARGRPPRSSRRPGRSTTCWP